MSNEFAEKKIRKFVSYYMREHKNAFKKGTSPGNVLWSELKQFILKNWEIDRYSSDLKESYARLI